MGDIEKEKKGPSENPQLAEIQKQLEELKQAIAQGPEAVSKEAQEFANTINEANAETKKKIQDETGIEVSKEVSALEVLKGVIDDVERERGSLLELAKAVNAADVDDELAAFAGNPEKNPDAAKSVLPLIFEGVDKSVGMLESTNTFGERGKGYMEQVAQAIRSFALSMVERFAYISIPVLGEFKLMSDADIKVLADRRFTQTLRELEANPKLKTLKSEYDKNPDKFKADWYLAYENWIKKQEGDAPVLAAIVGAAPVQQESVAKKDEEPAETSPEAEPEAVAETAEPEVEAGAAEFFAKGSMKRAIENNPLVTPLEIGGKTLRFDHKKSFVVQDTLGGSLRFQIRKADTPLELYELTRTEAGLDNPAQFSLKVGDKTFTLANLVNTIEAHKTNPDVTIEGLNLFNNTDLPV